MYFDWVNRNWYGSNELKALAGLRFFQWLHDEYGMQLDIFMLDAGTMDNGPNCGRIEGRPAYGDLQSPWFREAFPRGFNPLYQAAQAIGARLGLWIGIDGFGDTPEDARRRLDILSKLTRDYRMALFKFDACCSGLRPEKEKYYIEAMTAARAAVPDLIVLNHRIKLSPEAGRFATTFLWEGRETYIDVSGSNTAPAPHHRLFTMQRGLPPGLQRLTEDHGVCLSSALDHWEDDLILQAFSRSLIIAPEIYGSPWLLRDSEFPRLARIFNLHQKYNSLLVDAVPLEESDYGPFAVARGDGGTRFITMRNLSWNPVRRYIQLDSTIGLTGTGTVQVRQYHPTERVMGSFNRGDRVEVEILPFRSSLLMVTTAAGQELSVTGIDYEVTRDVPGAPVEMKLLGMPGTSHEVHLTPGGRSFQAASLEGARNAAALLKGGSVTVAFPGEALKEPYHRKVAEPRPAEVPPDAEALYEADCFRADNNALEVRSLERSGASRIAAVNEARAAFFEDRTFADIGIWDKFAFDSDMKTAFHAHAVESGRGQKKTGALRVDLRQETRLDRIVLRGVPPSYDPGVAEVSLDLRMWTPIEIRREGADVTLIPPAARPVRYARVWNAPLEVAEIEGYRGNAKVARSGWRASNLFRLYKDAPATVAWSAKLTLNAVAKNSYLAVAIPGNYGPENAYAALRVAGQLRGAGDRAASYPFNNFEANGSSNGNYTYYFPIANEVSGKEIEVVVLGFAKQMKSVQPEVWLTAYPIPFESKTLTLR